METTLSAPFRPKFWKPALLFGAVHFLVMTYGAFIIEQRDCQWVVPAYFMALPVMSLIIQRAPASMLLCWTRTPSIS